MAKRNRHGERKYWKARIKRCHKQQRVGQWRWQACAEGRCCHHSAISSPSAAYLQHTRVDSAIAATHQQQAGSSSSSSSSDGSSSNGSSSRRRRRRQQQQQQH